MKLKIAFFGTPEFAADLLEKIISDKNLPVEVAFVVTQPDQPVGRKKIITPSPVKQIAEKHKILVFDQLQASSFKLHEIDLALVYSYARLIPAELLKAPRLGFWNIHPSLLPKYRGASPMVYPLILGDKKTGVTLMQMVEKMDAGPIIDQVEYDIQPQDRRPDLEKKLTNLGYDLFKNQILNSAGRLIQNDKDATYTRRLTRQDGFIPLSVLKKALQNEPLTSHELPSLIQDFMQKNNLDQLEQLDIRNSSKIIFDYFRGLFPWPGLWTLVPIEGVEKRLKITDISLSNLLTTNYQLLINKVQLEGKTEVSFEQFTKSYPALKL